MRRFLTLTLLVFLVAAGCSESTDNGDGEPGGSIVVQVSGEPEETRVYGSIVKAFEEDHPDIDVELVEIAEKDQHLARLTTTFAGGNPPDVFLVNFREYSQFVARGAIEPIEEHLDEAGIDTADYFPQPIEAFTYDDALQCMPQNISSLVTYYNVELFKEAKVQEPDDDWTWEGFRATAKALTQGNVDGLGIDPEIIRLAPFVWGNGGEIVDDLEAPTRFTLDEPAAREAVEFIVGLVREDGVVPTEQEINAQDAETRFTTGKLAMLLSSRRDTPVFREVTGLEWDVAPLPFGREEVGILHSDGYCIARESDEIDAATAFVGYAAGEQGQTIAALGGRTVPSLRAVADSPAFLDPTQAPSRSQVFLDGVPHIRRTPVIPTWPEIEDVAEEVLTRLFYEEGYTIDDAIRDLDEQAGPLFEEGAPG